MLQIEKLNILHKKDLRVLLKDFNFVLRKGDKAVLIGEEGNGKSTILKWIYQPQLVDSYIEATGECRKNGERLGYLLQELSQEENEKSVCEFFGEEELLWNCDPKELAALSKSLDIPMELFYADRKMKTLSGGEKVKMQIAKLELQSPTIWLLDEPSNDMDLETLQWLESWMSDSKKTILFISHDEILIERIANVVIHLEQLRRKTMSSYTVSRTSYRVYKEQRGKNRNHQIQKSLNIRREEKKRQEKLRQIQQKVEHDQNTISRQNAHGGKLLKKKMKTVKAMERRFEREKNERPQILEEETPISILWKPQSAIHSGKVVLEFQNEQLQVPSEDTNKRCLLAKDISLCVKGKEKICIVGKNGAGKTTLLKKIAKELLPREDIHTSYMPQNYEEVLSLDKTPIDYLALTGDKEEKTKLRTYLGTMKYTYEEMSHSISELSGGQKAKILLLKMSFSGANVLILDEPTRNFSPLSTPIIRKILQEYNGTIISVSHDRKYMAEVCDTFYELTEKGLVKRKKEEIIGER